MNKFKEQKIEIVPEKKLVGHHLEMSLIENTTGELFLGFMPNKKNIENALNENIYEVIEYNASHFKSFSPANMFTKWAAIEVSSFDSVPENMKTFTLQKGMYAVFLYKGLAKDIGILMKYIFNEWLLSNPYILDDRPHFNVLGNKYQNNNPNSEEFVYIPIKHKS